MVQDEIEEREFPLSREELKELGKNINECSDPKKCRIILEIVGKEPILEKLRTSKHRRLQDLFR